MIIWCMVPEIWSVMGRIFVILDWFLSFYNPKNQNFEKLKKKPGDIIILHMRTMNDNQIMYDSWDIEYDRQTFLLFWAIFCPFTALTAQKIKLSKKWKKVWRYHHFTHVYQKLWFDDVRFLRNGVRQTDGQTNRKSDTQRWVSHLKKSE